MTMQSKLLASGSGWRVFDVNCAAGPRDRAFEERHETVCLAAVTAGTFQYRSTTGRALLAPGSVLLGNQGQCFECGHEHGRGDRCVSVHFDGSYWQDIVAAVPGARAAGFAVPRLPPLPVRLPLLSRLEAARTVVDVTGVVEELALHLAGVVVATLADSAQVSMMVSRREELRIDDALRLIEQRAPDPLPLGQLAGDVAMSPYHFLRTFARVVGTTPHQYVLRTRLQRAAVALQLSDVPVARVALDAGFNDLSTFHGHFQRWMGVTPHVYRISARRGNGRQAGATVPDGRLDCADSDESHSI